MDKCERVYAALEGKPVDKTPLSLWRHFHKQDQTPTGLVSATLAFYRKYDFDLIKLTPSGLYPIEDWGAQIALSKDDDEPPRLKKPVIREPEDWRHLNTLSPTEGTYGDILEAVRLLSAQLNRDDAPVLMTIFSPMTIAYKLAGDVLLEHLQTHPTDVQIGLATIAETTSRFASAVIEAGAHGIFFATQFSRADLLSEKMCMDFVVRYDLIALERVKNQPVPLIVHLHGRNIYFDTVNHYPAHAVSWHSHETGPTLEEALTRTDKTLMTGLDRRLLEHGTPEEVVAQAANAIRATGGRRLILAPPCVIPPATPAANLEALARMDRSLPVSEASAVPPRADFED
ncbi:MAG: uroporphyrinogen decarboxylase [Chloroflexi bacterium]|nr:MAG: uroporphyrinogen decarboxylase [Chloroflexota bacterium]